MTPLLLAALLAATPRIEAFVAGCEHPADGFSLPALRGAVTASAAGTVRAVGEGQLELSHCFTQNHQVRVVHARYEGLQTVEVKPGDLVQRGQRLGRGKQVRAWVDDQRPADFIPGRERLLVPAREPVLLVVDVDSHQAVRFERGAPTHQWEVGQGQAVGEKVQRGDLRTPRGVYFVVERTTGPFTGEVAAYFGAAWVKVNYPNAFDAERGVDAGLINRAQAEAISSQWRRRATTLQGTRLGGGIGFHGWNAPWDGADGGFELSWGCVVLHPEEMRRFYELVPLGTAVVLL